MSVLEWKNFNLFKLIALGDNKKIKNIKSDIICQSFNDEYQVYCDSKSFVYIFAQNWECVSFQVEQRPIKLCSVTKGNGGILITLIQDDISNDIFIHIFNIKKVTKKSGAILLGTARLTSILSLATVIKTAFADAQLCIGIGFERGDIQIFKGNINRDISLNFRNIPVTTRAITGIAFKEIENSKLCMFVSTNAGVFSFTINDINSVTDTKNVLDTCIENTYCYDLRSDGLDDAYFTVGREKAIYCYTNDGRGPCYILDGEKISINWFGDILIVVMNQHHMSPITISTTKLIMVDVKNKIIVFNQEIHGIDTVIIQQRNCYVITKTKQIFILRERNMSSKIRMLLKKNLFDVALNQLHSTHSDQNSISEIHMEYADYLFERSEFQKATEMYIKTIGVIDAYNVIRKLLDSRYTKYLIQYLQALLRTEYANKDILELLKNCKERVELPARFETELLYRDSATINDTNIKNVNDILANNQKEINENEIFDFIVENKENLELNHYECIVKILKCLISDGKCTNVERFIALLIPKRDKCIDILEHAISIDENNNKLLLYLFEFYLKAWKETHAPSDMVIVKFLKNYEAKLNIEKVIILCRIYSFWYGIIYLFEKNYDNCLSALYLTKNTDFSAVLENTVTRESLNTNIWVQALQKSKMNNKASSNYIHFLHFAMLTKQSTSILQILEGLASNKDVHIQHIRDCFTQELLENINGSKAHHNLIAKLKLIIKDIKLTLNNYNCNPIEFRKSICDKCRQELTLPATYFLCQHAFHKDCLGFYSTNNVCTICPLNTVMLLSEQMLYDNENKALASVDFDDSINIVSKHLGNGILFKHYDEHEINKNPNRNIKSERNQEDKFIEITKENSQWAGRFVIKKSTANRYTNNLSPSKEKDVSKTNPFDDHAANPFEEYDDNLNPFIDD